ncbi:replication-relaxation family protein, partial [Nitrolancea hollandica]|uniref:replication-relaxation family protein n=1 Tax=Nitrolancea hollandica TaxID=1206749 RepID=UPI0005910F56
LRAYVATWAELQADPGRLATLTGAHPADPVAQPGNLQPLRLRRPASRLPSLVGDPFRDPAPRHESRNQLGRVALHLTATDRRLLDLVGRHPFLTPDRLAVVLGWKRQWVRRRRNRLIALGLLRLVGSAEIGDAAGSLELVELTLAGLELVAAQQGLSMPRAVRLNGLVGGGPATPVGARRVLLRNLAHTLAVDGIFLSLIQTSGKFATVGWDDALHEWRNATACSRGHLRPDGYGVYRHHGRNSGFFLELDRGTMNRRDYLRKFAAYHRYHETGRFARD